MSYRRSVEANVQIATVIATTDGNTVLIAAPGAGKRLVIQALTVCVTTAAAQSFTLDDGTTTLFAAPASLAVGTYGADYGPVGQALAENAALSYTATAGVGCTLSGFGYIRDL